MDTIEPEDHQFVLPQNFLTTDWPNQERGHYITTILNSKPVQGSLLFRDHRLFLSFSFPFCLLRAPFSPCPPDLSAEVLSPCA